MAFQLSLRLTRIPKQIIRKFSAEAKLIGVNVNDKTGFATVTLQRPPVNGLNLDLLNEFSTTLTQLENNKCRGMILTSSNNNVFSGGLDIMEMYKPDPDRVKSFWTTLQETWMKLYGTSFPTVAAINGHSPAGGCLLAMSCEYRVMVNNFTIGLNETQLGIVAPSWFIATMRNTIGTRQTELALTQGRLFKTDEALLINLIDEVAASKEDALEKSEKFLMRFAKINPMARSATKIAIRQNDIQDLLKNQEQDLNNFIGYVSQDKVQKGLEMYLAALKQKRAA